jgi:hypothetical protein
MLNNTFANQAKNTANALNMGILGALFQRVKFPP